MTKLKSKFKRKTTFKNDRLSFFLIGEKGIIQFVMIIYFDTGAIYGADVGYHSPKETYGGTKMSKCYFHKNGCWYDGSSLLADDYLELLKVSGIEAVWNRMKNLYIHTFLQETK